VYIWIYGEFDKINVTVYFTEVAKYNFSQNYNKRSWFYQTHVNSNMH